MHLALGLVPQLLFLATDDLTKRKKGFRLGLCVIHHLLLSGVVIVGRDDQLPLLLLVELALTLGGCDGLRARWHG